MRSAIKRHFRLTLIWGSGVLCAAALAGWAATLWGYSAISYEPRGHFFSLGLGSAQVYLQVAAVDESRPGSGAELTGTRQWDASWIPRWAVDDRPWPWRSLGFQKDSSTEQGDVYEIPLWAVVLFTALLPGSRTAKWLQLWIRRRRRRAAGRCEWCGYDLRASRGACPECGKLAPINSGRPAPQAAKWRRAAGATVGIAAGTIVLIAGTAAAAASVVICLRLPKSRKMPYQWLADRCEWHWSDGEADIDHSIARAPPEYKFEVRRNSRAAWDNLRIGVLSRGKPIYAWDDERDCAFVVKGTELVYAYYHVSNDGCTLIAVDLSTGKELWRSRLLAAEAGPHSAYENRVRMNLFDYHTVVVWGNETYGRYVGFVDLETGRTVGHKIFPEEPQSQPAE